MSLADLAASIGRKKSIDPSEDVVDVITFVEAPWGLGLKLFPIQRVILKAHYGMALDDNPHGFPLDKPVPKSHPAYNKDLMDEDGYYAFRISITDFKRENPRFLTEAGYLSLLFDEGRCNIREVVPGKQRREMVLSIGRRSGKTLITSCIVAYETYKLLLKGNPQKFYGSSQSNVIQLISVATGTDQASLSCIEKLRGTLPSATTSGLTLPMPRSLMLRSRRLSTWIPTGHSRTTQRQGFPSTSLSSLASPKVCAAVPTSWSPLMRSPTLVSKAKLRQTKSTKP